MGVRITRAVSWVLVSAVAAFGLAACSSSPSSSPSAHHSSSTTRLSAVDAPTRVSFGSGTVGPADPTTTVPAEVNGAPVQPQFAAGQNILITSTGFQPQTLEANVTSPVVWINRTDHAQRLIFEHFPIDSGTIPPGGTFTWTSTDAVALGYRSTTGWQGKLLMNQPNP